MTPRSSVSHRSRRRFDFVMPFLAGLALLSALSISAAPAVAGKSGSWTEVREGEPNSDWLMSGTWRAGPDDDRDEMWISFRVDGRNGSRSEHWSRLDPSELEGLDIRRLPDPHTLVDFRVKRDAGAIHATGEFNGRRGAGTFTLELDSQFADALARRGVGRPTRAQQARLLISGANLSLLDALAREKYPNPDVEQLVRMVNHGVNEEYITEMSRAGYHLPGIEEMVRARDHGVDPEFIRAMMAAGYRDLEFEMLLRARDHGADPQFIEDLADAGYKSLPLSVLIRARDHGVDGTYIESLRRAGFQKLSLEEMIRARDHGVTGGFARRARERRPEVSLDEVIAMRDRGVSP